MSFIIKKPMPLNGVKYNPGDVVADSEVLPRRVKMLTNTGYIVHVEDAEPPKQPENEQPNIEPPAAPLPPDEPEQNEKQEQPEDQEEPKPKRKLKKGGDA